MKKSAVTLDKKGGTTHSVLLMGRVAVGVGGGGEEGVTITWAVYSFRYSY